MSTSCLIILPSAHLSTARASPRNVGTRSCRKAKKGTSHPLSQEKVLPDLRNQSLGTFLKCSCSSPVSLPRCPEENTRPGRTAQTPPQALLTHQQAHVEMITLYQKLGPVAIYGNLHL